MKRKITLSGGCFLLTATALFTGCSSDDDFLMEPVDSGTANPSCNESGRNLDYHFDDFDSGMLAGPTSAGENLYSYQGYPQVTTIYDNTRKSISSSQCLIQ